MFLSIALCTYNGSLYLQEQLKSIVAQSRLPDELVICDDCSGDDTVKVALDFAASAPFTVHVIESARNVGVVKNFEKAIVLCRGDIIVLCDQDDVWLPRKLALLEAEFVNPNTTIAFSNADVVGADLRPLGVRLWDCVSLTQDKQKRMQTDGAFAVLQRDSLVTGAALAFRATIKPVILPIPNEMRLMVHDGWIATIGAALGKVALVDQPLFHYRRHSKQHIGVQPTRSTSPLPSAHLLDSLRPLNALRDRLLLLEASGTSGPRIPQYIELLTERIRHIETRIGLAPPKLSQIPTWMKELTSGRYHQYSNGWRSAVKDLITVRGYKNSPFIFRLSTVVIKRSAHTNMQSRQPDNAHSGEFVRSDAMVN